MVRFIINFLKTIAILVGIFFLALIAYAIWQWWDTKNLQVFCSEVKPGTEMSAIPTLAESHHLNPRWLTKGSILDEKTKTWFIYLPAESTMGDVVCEIEHNKTTVISSKYNE